MALRRAKIVLVKLALVALALAMLPCIGQGEPPAKGKKPAASVSKSQLKPEQFATPEATFATVQKLLADKKYKDYVRCYTDDGLAECAGGLRMATAMMAAFGPPEDDKAMVELHKQIKQLVERFKLTAEAGPAIEINFDKSAEEQSASMRAGMIAGGKAIKDRAGFVAAASKLLFEGYATKTGKSATADSKLTDLKIDGEQAQAKLSPGWMGDGPADLVFRRIDGQWKIDSLGNFSVTTSTTTEGPGVEMPGKPGEEKLSITGTVTITPGELPTVSGLGLTPEKPAETPEPTGTSRPSQVPAATTPSPEKPARPAAPDVASQPAVDAPVVETPDGPAGPAPKLVVEQPRFYFGEAESGSDVRHTFVLKNVGDAPLEITKFWQSGGISHTPAGRTTIAPGEQLELEATLSLKSQRAKLIRELHVHSNDPAKPEFPLYFSGVAVPRAKVDPPRVELGEVVGSASVSKTFKVTGERGLSFNITGTKTSDLTGVVIATGKGGQRTPGMTITDKISVEVKTVTPGTEYEVTVTVAGPLPAGQFKGWVRLITDNRGEYHAIGVPIIVGKAPREPLRN